MKQMFFYTRKEKVNKPLVNGLEQLEEFKEKMDSFNLSKVIRTIEMDNGDVLVLLDDLHPRKQEVPVFNKRKEITSYKNETNTFQSEITLLKDTGDVERFYKVTNIEL